MNLEIVTWTVVKNYLFFTEICIRTFLYFTIVFKYAAAERATVTNFYYEYNYK